MIIYQVILRVINMSMPSKGRPPETQIHNALNSAQKFSIPQGKNREVQRNYLMAKLG